MKKSAFVLLALAVAACSETAPVNLPRAEASPELQEAVTTFIAKQDSTLAGPMDYIHNNQLHSVMILKDGKVVSETFLHDTDANAPHYLFSVSKTFTAAAVGMCVRDGLLSVDDKVIGFFPEDAPAQPSENLQKMTVRDLLTMSCGHDTDPTFKFYPVEMMRESIKGPVVHEKGDSTWVQRFLALPVEHEPGTFYCYNSMSTYMLSAIVQKLTGEELLDFLTPRLFEPLNIDTPVWEESPEGINTGGWGLYLKTEDLAKFGQLLLQEGKWYGKQIIPADWVKEMGRKQMYSQIPGIRKEENEIRGILPDNSECLHGYGYQTWRNRLTGYRADGALGQYILIIPDKDAVAVITSLSFDTNKVLRDFWETIYPVL